MLNELLKSETATAAGNTTPALTPPVGIGGGELLSFGASMIIVVAAILVLGWLYSRSKFVGSGNSDVINVVATRALGPKERLMVVEVAEQQLLVGMTSTGVQTLHVFDKPVVVASKQSNPSGFASRLRSAVQEIGK